MKTSGVSCETKFGLLGFLGHPSDDDDDDKSKFDDSDILRSFGQNSEIKLKKRAGQNPK